MKSGLFGTEPLSPTARRVLIAGCVGFAVDFFDIYLPILALAPVTRYFQPPGLSAAATTTIYFFIFAATLLGRPCGAVIFGHWADRIGRRRTTIISIIGFGVFTLLIACLPGYATIGLASLILLILLRFIDGGFHGWRVHIEQYACPGDGPERSARFCGRRPAGAPIQSGFSSSLL